MTPITNGYSCRVCGNSTATVAAAGLRDWEYGVEGEWDYAACIACNMVQLHPFPDLALLERAYDIDYHGYVAPEKKGWLYNTLNAMAERGIRATIRKIMPAQPAVLDVGCGSGAFLALLKDMNPSRLDGIDFSPKAAAAATARGVKMFTGLFLDFPSPPAVYDLVIMNNYLEHTLEPVAELRRAHEVLKPDGVLYGQLPNFAAVERSLMPRFWGGNHVPRHTFQFTPETLTQAFKKAGFTRIALSYPPNSSHMALTVQNWLQRKVTDLRNNPALKHGRARYYNLLLLLVLPLHMLFIPFKKTGFIDFRVSK